MTTVAAAAPERVPYRGVITACAMGATLMQALDQTIANVALPYMRGSLSASFDEITWVLTSYITAAAIMTASVGWMAQRFGRKRLFIFCLVGFTITSMLCGAALLDGVINRQAQIIAYVDDYKLMIFTTLPALLLLFLMRRPRVAVAPAVGHAALD